MSIKESLKQSTVIRKLYRTLRRITVDRPLTQNQILNIVLKYNTKRFMRYSGAYTDSKGKDTAYITWLYHVIEKGIAMRDMRPGFGQEKIKELCELTIKYGKKYGCDNITYQSCVATIREYIYVNREKNVQFDDDVSVLLSSFDNIESTNRGGVLVTDIFCTQGFEILRVCS